MRVLWHLEGTPLTIEDAQAPVMKLWEEVTVHQGGPSGKAVDQADMDWSAAPESFREPVGEMLASDPWFQITWNHKRTDLKDTSLSGYDIIEHMSSSQRTNWCSIAPPFPSRRVSTVAEVRETLEDTF